MKDAVKFRIRNRIRPYFTVVHDLVLRSFMKTVNERFSLRKSPYTVTEIYDRACSTWSWLWVKDEYNTHSLTRPRRQPT